MMAPATTIPQIDDPFESAKNAEVRSGSGNLFGQMTVSAYYCVLVKGQGKVQYDASQHRPEDRRTALDLVLTGLSHDGRDASVFNRNIIAESKEWTKIIRPSLLKLGLEPRTLNGRFVHLKLVPTGEKYQGRDGETKDRTTFELLASYNTEAECRAAAEAFFNSEEPNHTTSPVGGGSGSQVQNTPAPNGINHAERETAKAFLAPLWNSCAGDTIRFGQLIASTPPVNKYFTLASPDVQAIVGG